MTSSYQIEVDELEGDLGALPDPATPVGEALSWWIDRVQRRAYVGLRTHLPSSTASRVLRDRELITETPGGWAFVVRGPHTEPAIALRRNVWALVKAASDQYAPAAIDRMSAVSLAIGDESIASTTYLRHGASESKRDLELMQGYKIVLQPDRALAKVAPDGIGGAAAAVQAIDTTVVTLGTMPSIQLPVMGAAPLLTLLTLGDLRDNLDTIVVWLRTLFLGRAALERAFEQNPRKVLFKRMGDLSRDAGNSRLADTIDEVLNARSRAHISRTHTGVGQQFIVPPYLAERPAAATPWLERHRVRMARGIETVSSLLGLREAALPLLSAENILTVARAAKAEDTYHSTTIEGYRITREEVRAVIEGKRYEGRSPADTERLMALKGYAQAFDWTLVQIREVALPVDRPLLSEPFILDLFAELWSPSVDAGVVTAPDLRAWRNHAVQINSSDHVPPAWEKLPGLMTQFVTQLNAAAAGPVTRAVVGHWTLVHLHPFKDGNGRVARLLMNYLLSAAGLPWTTIRAEERPRYFTALERAHMHQDITPLALFIADAVDRAYSSTARE